MAPQLPLPPQLSTDPNVNASAMAWAAQLVDQLQKLYVGGITSAMIADGTIVNADLSGGYPQLTAAQAACSGALTLTTSAQDVTGCSVSLPAATYLVTGVFNFYHSVNGGGLAVGTLSVGGTPQTAQATLLNTGSANGDQATVTQSWIFSIGSTSTVKLQAVKTINAGTVQALNANTVLTYQRLS